MAKKSSSTVSARAHILKPKKKRKGVHSKSKKSKNKNSKNYQKMYASQG